MLGLVTTKVKAANNAVFSFWASIPYYSGLCSIEFAIGYRPVAFPVLKVPYPIIPHLLQVCFCENHFPSFDAIGYFAADFWYSLF